MKCLITENNKIVDVVYRVKPSPPLPSLPPLCLCRRSHRLIKRQNNGGERRNSITAFPRGKKKQPRHSLFLFDNTGHIREQSIFRFSTTVRHPFVAWKFNWKTEGSRENFLPSFLPFEIFPRTTKKSKQMRTRFNRVFSLFFSPLWNSLVRMTFLVYRLSNSTRDSDHQ